MIWKNQLKLITTMCERLMNLCMEFVDLRILPKHYNCMLKKLTKLISMQLMLWDNFTMKEKSFHKIYQKLSHLH